MDKNEFKFRDKPIIVEEKEKLPSTFKIRAYKQNLKLMEQRKIPQKSIDDVLNSFFIKDKILSNKVKESINKIIYCQKDRIIVFNTKLGREIIKNRSFFTKKYGWFFFIEESKKEGKLRKEKKNVKKEKTLSIEEFNYNGLIIILKQKINMRPLYKTKEYRQYLNFIKSEGIEQKSIKETLNDLFYKNKQIPVKEKKSIKKIIYYQQEKVIVIKSLIGDRMYDNLKDIVRRYGWYFYITGVPVGPSDISIAIDRIEKRYNVDYFKELSLINNKNNNEKIKITLYPIVLKPNHNCQILGIGNINILLDCGISQDYLNRIKDYLENFEVLLSETKKTVQIKGKRKKRKEDLEIIENLKNFEKENVDQRVIKEKEDTLISDEIISIERKIDAIFVSHSHFDHISGLKDLIKLYPNVPILCSRITLDLYLLRDSDFLKQSSFDTLEDNDYRNVVKNVIYVENGEKIEFKESNCYLSFYHAGHMPGALMMFIKIKDFKFLFTGDYTYWDYSPFAGTRRFLEQISKPIDFLLIDATSAHETFDNPSEQFHSLILFLEQKAEYGDNSLIGADPSSLAISFMLTFWRYFRKLQIKRDYKKRPNIYVDMMVRKNIQVINHRYEYIYGPISRLIRDKANPFNSIKFRWFSHKDLDFLKTKNNIIISHPSDLSYGIIRNIISVIGRNSHNLVYLSGAIHEEPGLSLIYPPINNDFEEKKSLIGADSPEESEELDNIEFHEETEECFEPKVIRENSKPPLIVFSEKWKFPFRALLLNHFAPNLKIKLHGDKTQLIEMIKSLEPKEVCFFHQNPKKLIDVAEEIKLFGVEKVSFLIKRKLHIIN
ncbi:MAG: MBL fold metallo-hydrolase [Promethearchaeota archaeon]